MKTRGVRHDENLARLARIEGQIRGIAGMIRDGKYCVDIITQIQAVEAALTAVGKGILKKHMQHCVQGAFQGKSRADAVRKINELTGIMNLNTKITKEL